MQKNGKGKHSVRDQIEPGLAFENLKDLPTFADNHEFYVLGSTLTRDARLGQLLIDVFFMGTKVSRVARRISRFRGPY
jgi:hypothetical protein